MLTSLKEQEQALLKQVAATNASGSPFPPQNHVSQYDVGGYGNDDGEYEVLSAPVLVIPSTSTL